MSEQQSKACKKCGVVKPLDAFGVFGKGLHHHCKQCRAEKERSRPAEYKCWKNMKARCSNPKHPDYCNYGARGITVCAEWLGKGGYERFIAHAGPRPTPKHQLDRIDNERGYEPGNVRWVLSVVNNRNKRTTPRLTWNGETKTVVEWATQFGVKHTTIVRRLKHGWTAEEAIFGKHATAN